MAKLPLTDVKVDIHGYYEGNTDHCRAALSWHRGEQRFHLWFFPDQRKAGDASHTGHGTIYKHLPDRLHPIQLSAGSKPSLIELAEVWATVDRDRLIEKAFDEAKAAEAKRLSELRERVATQRKQAAGPNLYDALKVVASHLNNPANDGNHVARANLIEIIDKALAEVDG